MKGSYSIIVQNKRLQYKFTCRRNITIIKGDSATGKTTLIEMIQEYNDNGEESGVSIQSERDCVVLGGRFWRQELNAITDSIVFLDEGSRFVTSEEFARAIRDTNNYYVIVTRESLENIPYSVNEIYGIHQSGKYANLKQTYHEFYHIYEENKLNTPIQVSGILTEDSKSGFQFFHKVCQDNGWKCWTAKEKSKSCLSTKESPDQDIECDGILRCEKG